MKQRLTSVDIYDIFAFPEDGDMCQLLRRKHTKEELLRGDYLQDASGRTLQKCFLYIVIPSLDRIALHELSAVLNQAQEATNGNSFLMWDCSEDDEIDRFELFLIKIFES